MPRPAADLGHWHLDRVVAVDTLHYNEHRPHRSPDHGRRSANRQRTTTEPLAS
jgi:hypothetical protein